MHLRRRELSDAITRFERVLELDRSNEAAHHNLGAAYFNAGEFPRAVEILERGIFYWPASGRIHALLGASLFESGSRERAAISLARALELEPANELAVRYREIDR